MPSACGWGTPPAHELEDPDPFLEERELELDLELPWVMDDPYGDGAYGPPEPEEAPRVAFCPECPDRGLCGAENYCERGET
jgi:hypothetical protein